MRTDKEVGKVAAPVPAVIYILYCGVEVPVQWAQLVSCAHVLFGHFLDSLSVLLVSIERNQTRDACLVASLLRHPVTVSHGTRINKPPVMGLPQSMSQADRKQLQRY